MTFFRDRLVLLAGPRRRRRRWPFGSGALLVALVGAGSVPRGVAEAATTYYVAPGGDDGGPGSLALPWATIGKAAATLLPGDTVLIRAGTYRERVQATSSGAVGAFIVYAAYPGEAPVLDGTGVTLPNDLAGLFEIVGVAYVRVQGLRVQNVGPWPQNAGFLVENAQHVVLQGNVVDDTTSSGIGVWGSLDVTLDGNEVVRACHGGIQEQVSVGGTTGFVVTNNRVHDPGGTANGGEGICLKDGSSGGLVRGNRVFNLPRAVGIYVDAWDKHTFDIDVSGNLVHDVANGNGIALASEMGGLLEDIRVMNNVSWGNGWLGLLVAGYGGVATHPMRNLRVVNNTLVGNGTAGWGGGLSVDSQEVDGMVVRNNAVSGNASFQIVVSPGVPAAQVTVDHNLVHPFLGYEGEIRGTPYVEADPAFVDAEGHDYRLSAASPAIDQGSATSAPSVDFDGIARPQGGAFDIGAFERRVGGGARFYTLPPCRLLDTRGPAGPLGGPPLRPSSARIFAIAGSCALPASARSISANVTVTNPGAPGHLALFPGDGAAPDASNLNFVPGQTRANSTVVVLSGNGSGTVGVLNGSAGSVDVILDVNGYFE